MMSATIWRWAAMPRSYGPPMAWRSRFLAVSPGIPGGVIERAPTRSISCNVSSGPDDDPQAAEAGPLGARHGRTRRRNRIGARRVQRQPRVFLQPQRPQGEGRGTRPPGADRRPRRERDLSRSPDGRMISFRVTDGAAEFAVLYEGLLPDLFREGQGVVAEGKLRAHGIFAATTVLAKHDENYMPREVVEALKKSGHWQEGGAANAAVVVTPAQAGAQGLPAKPAAPGFPLSRE